MPETLKLAAGNPTDVTTAARLLREGRLVAFATETVYGLGANALSTEAVARIFVAKQRPSWDPVIVHLASTEQLAEVTLLTDALRSRVTALAAAFWPGPLTLLLPRKPAIPDSVTAGRPLVGVRIPAHPAAHALLVEAGIPIAAPSANLFAHTSPTNAAHVLADLDGKIDAVLDAGPTTIGLESSVLDPTQTPMVLYRPGAITAEQLEAATGVPVNIFQPEPTHSAPESLPSPGVGIRHYAPRARLVLVDASPTVPAHSLLSVDIPQKQNVGAMLPNSWVTHPNAHVFPWGAWDQPEELALHLFEGLRYLDALGVDVILCPLPPPGGIADAIRDRLQKAARTA